MIVAVARTCRGLCAGLLALAATGAGSETLTPVWELAGLEKPESTVYDPARGVLYVSNIAGETTARDGNGYIARVDLDGKLLDAAWIDGLHGPKGLALAGDRLYVADIDTLIEIDIPGARVLARHLAPEGKFFNDVTVGGDGGVFVSDSATNRIYNLRDGKLTVWIESPGLDGPNGLLAEADRLIVGAWGKEEGVDAHGGQLLAVAFADRAITSVSSDRPIGQLDGVESHPAGGYLLTDWFAGTLLRIDGTGHISTLLTLNRGLADHEYIADRHLLVLPQMLDGKLKAYRLEP